MQHQNGKAAKKPAAKEESSEEEESEEEKVEVCLKAGWNVFSLKIPLYDFSQSLLISFFVPFCRLKLQRRLQLLHLLVVAKLFL